MQPGNIFSSVDRNHTKSVYRLYTSQPNGLVTILNNAYYMCRKPSILIPYSGIVIYIFLFGLL